MIGHDPLSQNAAKATESVPVAFAGAQRTARYIYESAMNWRRHLRSDVGYTSADQRLLAQCRLQASLTKLDIFFICFYVLSSSGISLIESHKRRRPPGFPEAAFRALLFETTRDRLAVTFHAGGEPQIRDKTWIRAAIQGAQVRSRFGRALHDYLIAMTRHG